MTTVSNESQVELEDDEDRVARKPRRRRNVFLDDEADCDDMNDEDNECLNNDSDNEFIDDSEHSQGSQEVLATKRRELEANKIALFTYLKELTKEELANLGMKFDLTQIEDLFE